MPGLEGEAQYPGHLEAQISLHLIFFKWEIPWCLDWKGRLNILATSKPRSLSTWYFKWEIPWCLDWKGRLNTLATSKPRSLSTWFFFLWGYINPLTPNDHYSGRTAPLTSKHCILYIYSTNIGTEYFKHGIYSPFFLFKMQFVS